MYKSIKLDLSTSYPLAHIVKLTYQKGYNKIFGHQGQAYRRVVFVPKIGCEENLGKMGARLFSVENKRIRVFDSEAVLTFFRRNLDQFLR